MFCSKLALCLLMLNCKHFTNTVNYITTTKMWTSFSPAGVGWYHCSILCSIFASHWQLWVLAECWQEAAQLFIWVCFYWEPINPKPFSQRLLALTFLDHRLRISCEMEHEGKNWKTVCWDCIFCPPPWPYTLLKPSSTIQISHFLIHSFQS